VEREAWLKEMQTKAEGIYDLVSPQYWVNYGIKLDEAHLKYLDKFLGRFPPQSSLLSAACGAGRYDGLLAEAGHSVLGIDQSAGMLARARQHFPNVRYQKMGLQELDFQDAFDGATCIDALEHICPEDWPLILRRFQAALKPGGLLYFTVDRREADEADQLQAAYQRAKDKGLPVVYGEVADQVDELYERVKKSGWSALPDELADFVVYHYCPSMEQVLVWLNQTGFGVEDEGTGKWYEHFVVKKMV
jgi:SAM-dependent methyltransferase